MNEFIELIIFQFYVNVFMRHTERHELMTNSHISFEKSSFAVFLMTEVSCKAGIVEVVQSITPYYCFTLYRYS